MRIQNCSRIPRLHMETHLFIKKSVRWFAIYSADKHKVFPLIIDHPDWQMICKQNDFSLMAYYIFTWGWSRRKLPLIRWWDPVGSPAHLISPRASNLNPMNPWRSVCLLGFDKCLNVPHILKQMQIECIFPQNVSVVQLCIYFSKLF